MQTDWKSFRVIHLSGGCRAVNGLSQQVEFAPKAINGKMAGFSTRAYGAIFSDCETLGLSIVGADFISHSLEAKGLTPADWRAYHRLSGSVWSNEDEIRRWSNIGHAAFSRNNGRMWDVASRISHQLRVCAWRLRQISDSYMDQLNARVNAGEFRVGTRFEDGFTWLAYLAVQVFLVDACVLRDYFAEYYYQFICPDPANFGGGPITSMGALRRRVLDKINSEDAATKTLKDVTAEDGWLHKLGSYRDLVVHSAPLAKAQNRLFAVSVELPLGNSGALPAIRLPIPADPKGIAKARATGEHFEDFARQFELFVQAAQGEAPSSDGLIYAHSVLGQLTYLARLLGDQSPVPPEMPHFDETNIIGPVTVRHV